MEHTIAPEQKTTPQEAAMRGYYRWQSLIYDLTRWSFLFGRNEILTRLPVAAGTDLCLLEVGCGTGRNLLRLAKKHPNMRLMGLDVSPDMLQRAAKATESYSRRILLLEKAYGPAPVALPQVPDMVLFSYALTMFNPGWEQAIAQARADLPDGGYIAVVDFHDTPSRLFRWWMGKNHVRMDGHLLPLLEKTFQTEYRSTRSAFFGLWRYVIFIGKKR
jgi:S-adenosylmethionine-diacylgycerolhomoserine-N-methlytransferase